MDEPGRDAVGPDVARDPDVAPAPDVAGDIVALLRALADRQLTPAESTDLDDVLGELELAVHNGMSDRSELSRANGDLRILDFTAAASGPGVGPLSRGQRDRIKRLVPALTPARRRVMPRWRRS